MCWAQIAGTAAQAGSSALQGGQNADTLNANADVLDLKAEDALKRGGISEDIQRNKTAQMMGFQRAAMGSSGVQVDSGSFGKVLEQTATMGEFDAQTTRSNAMREAWNYSTEASNQRAAAEAAMGMADLLMPGGKNFQKKFILGETLLPQTGAGLIFGAKDYNNKRTPWK